MKIIHRRKFLAASAMATAGAFLPRPLSATESTSSDWLSHGWDIEQTRHNTGESVLGPQNVSRLKLQWNFETGSGITGTPVVVGDRVIVGSWDGRVYALNRNSGKMLWSFDAGMRSYPTDRKLGVFASPAVAGRVVYIASDRVIAINLDDGKQLWERTIGSPEKTFEYFWAPPLVHGSRLYAGVSAGSETDTRARLVCLDTDTGAIRWTFFTVAPDVAGGALIAPPSLDPRTRTLYAATGSPFRVRPGPLRHSCSVLAIEASTGALRWADQVYPHDELNMDLNCPPMLVRALRNGRRADLIVVGGKGGIRAWDRQTKRRLWHVQITPSRLPDSGEVLPTSGPEFGPTAAAGGLVFFASNNHPNKSCSIAAIEATTGEIRWLHCLPAFQLGPVSVANGVVYLGLVDGKMRAWRARNGDLLWESAQGPPNAGGPAVA
ncbi:MAG TPA: PQQ-binding-like beta-propeller repeat protein, partial [Blastocatellia bacterium]|nr:PQQ-binding-like beta-propeller repeat protein [Blastocatellia bacterium]